MKIPLSSRRKAVPICNLHRLSSRTIRKIILLCWAICEFIYFLNGLTDFEILERGLRLKGNGICIGSQRSWNQSSFYFHFLPCQKFKTPFHILRSQQSTVYREKYHTEIDREILLYRILLWVDFLSPDQESLVIIVHT